MQWHRWEHQQDPFRSKILKFILSWKQNMPPQPPEGNQQLQGPSCNRHGKVWENHCWSKQFHVCWMYTSVSIHLQILALIEIAYAMFTIALDPVPGIPQGLEALEGSSLFYMKREVHTWPDRKCLKVFLQSVRYKRMYPCWPFRTRARPHQNWQQIFNPKSKRTSHYVRGGTCQHKWTLLTSILPTIRFTILWSSGQDRDGSWAAVESENVLLWGRGLWKCNRFIHFTKFHRLNSVNRPLIRTFSSISARVTKKSGKLSKICTLVNAIMASQHPLTYTTTRMQNAWKSAGDAGHAFDADAPETKVRVGWHCTNAQMAVVKRACW